MIGDRLIHEAVDRTMPDHWFHRQFQERFITPCTGVFNGLRGAPMRRILPWNDQIESKLRRITTMNRYIRGLRNRMRVPYGDSDG